MDYRQRIREVERTAREHMVPIEELCERANIHRATWQRWKSGKTIPFVRNWRALEEEVKKLEGETV